MALDFNQRRKSVLGAMAGALNPLPRREEEHPTLNRLNLSKTPPLPAPSEMNTEGVPPPPTPNEPRSPSASSGIIGPSLGGKQGVDRLRTIREAMQSADPSSDVKVRGDQVDIAPPRMKGVNEKGLWRRLGEGALIGLASADPNAEGTQILGSAIGGAAVSSDPRSADVLKRNFELRQLDNDYLRGLKVKGEEAQIGSIEALRRQREAEPELERQKQAEEKRINDEKLRIEEDRIQGLITNQEADRRMREADAKERARHNRALEDVASRNASTSAATSVTTAGDRATKLATEQAENAAKREAKINESAALYKKAEQMEIEAANVDQHIQKLEAGMATYDPADTDGRKPFLAQIEDLKKAQTRMREDANKLRTDGDKARADGESTLGPYSGQRIARGKLAEAAKRLKVTVEEAERILTEGGATIY